MRGEGVDWDALHADHPDMHLYSERRFWRVFWRYDRQRVEAARARAHLRRIGKAFEYAIIGAAWRWMRRRQDRKRKS